MKKLTKIRESARGEDCTIRIPGVCNFNSETTVFCHLNGAGMGIKKGSNEGAYGCSSCHDVVDLRVKSKYSLCEIKLWHLEAVMRTQKILIEKGLLILNE